MNSTTTRVVFKDGVFICKTSYEERAVPRDAGFRWHYDKKIWYTSHYSVAARLRELADQSAKDELDKHVIAVSPWTERLPEPPAPLKLLEFQREAAIFALSRNRSYLGLDPGLGKTIVAASIARAIKRAAFVYICPPFLVSNTQNEFEKWAPELKTTNIKTECVSDVLIVPDSIIARPEIRESIASYVDGADTRVLFIDEAHRYKNDTAQRTQSMFGKDKKTKGEITGIVDFFTNVVCMSGTPMPSRPLELYPVLSKLAPETIDHMNKFQYARKFCAAYKNEYGFWDFSGASNMPELRRRTIHPEGSFMLRIKKEVLKLPPITEEVFVISEDMGPSVSKLDRKLHAQFKDVEDVMKHQIAKAEGLGHENDLHLMTYRRLLGLEKVDAACDIVKSILEETEESVLIFGLHKDVIAKLTSKLFDYKPLVITGDVPVQLRQTIVKEFQENKDHRVFIGNIHACGVGFTLTKATRVVFVEFDWVPGTNDQARDRAYRIGTSAAVHCQYLVFRESVDKAVIESLLMKRKTIDQM